MKYQICMLCILFFGALQLQGTIPFDIDFTEIKEFSGPSFVIGSRRSGFFSNFLGVVHNMQWAQQNNRTPVVYWDHTSFYYDPSIKETKNVWEYYFEPVSCESYKQGDYVWINYYDPNKGEFPYHRKSCYFFNRYERTRINHFIKKHIHIKSHIKEKIDTFYTKHMAGKKTIGIHLRGTDKGREAKPIKPHVILDKANQLADEIGICQFLVATDEEKLLQQARSHLNRPVIYYDAYRSENGQPVHIRCSNYKIGEDILIEAMLLSQCDYFIHTRSNVSFGVCILNPNVPNIYFEN